MKDIYMPRERRIPDVQYQECMVVILEHGELVRETAQGIGALTCFGTLPPMVFDLSNGVPLITERKLISWRQAVAEIIAFVNGARTCDQILSYGCKLWESYREKDVGLPFPPDDMGPASYGPAFHDFPMPCGGSLNQFAQVLQQIRDFPHMRTHRITPWIPFWTARGPNRMVNVAPCHGELHFRVMNGRLHMRMDQRSADMPIGVPHNMIQYAALLLMMCQVTGYKPGYYIHSLSDAHIYENQIEAVKTLMGRTVYPFPTLHLDPSITDLFSFRAEHFALEEYEANPPMKIPYSP